MPDVATTTRSLAQAAESPPPFDTECAARLPAAQETVPLGLGAEDIPAFRDLSDAASSKVTNAALEASGRFRVCDLVAPGPRDAPDVPLLWCDPSETTDGAGLIFYVHGGGMISGCARTGVERILELAAELSVGVVSVDYRLAPETPHPGPLEDCFAAWCWTVQRAAEQEYDPTKIVVVGSSAGGGLAANLCLLNRDRGGPRPHGQLLITPMLDDRNDSNSARQMVGAGVWDQVCNETGWTALLGPQGPPRDALQYASASRATSLAGLPATYLDVGSAETFRDECVDYVARIWSEGGDAELHVWPGGFHGFSSFAPEAELSRAASRARLAWLRRRFAATH